MLAPSLSPIKPMSAQPHSARSASEEASTSSVIEFSDISAEEPEESPVPRRSILIAAMPEEPSVRVSSASGLREDFFSSANGPITTAPSRDVPAFGRHRKVYAHPFPLLMYPVFTGAAFIPSFRSLLRACFAALLADDVCDGLDCAELLRHEILVLEPDVECLLEACNYLEQGDGVHAQRLFEHVLVADR